MRVREEQVRQAIQNSANWAQALRILELHPTGANYRYLQSRVLEHSIDISHFRRAKKLVHITSDEFGSLVKKSTSERMLILACGLRVTNASRMAVRKRITQEGFNISHFKGPGWSRGLTKETDNRVRRNADHLRKYNDDDFLIENAPYWMCSGGRLGPILLRKGVKHICSECGVEARWNDKPLTLHVDHKNGKKHDNRLKNLRFLCPNCHQQTTTWGSRNIKK